MLARRVRLAGIEYLFCDERTAPPSGARRLRAQELQSLLARWGTQPVLRGMLADNASRRLERTRRLPPAGSSFGSRFANSSGISSGLGAEATDGLIAYELPTEVPHVSGMIEPVEFDLPEPPVVAPVPMFDEVKHWLEVEIIGEDDRGIPGVLCEIKLPSGRMIRRTTDRFGLIRVEGIDRPGNCEVTLPNHDRDAWDSA